MADDLANWIEAVAAMRLRAVVNLDLFPHEDEDISLIRLLAIAVMRGRA